MSDYGLRSYLETSKQIGERRRQPWPLVLLRMLLSKAAYGLSAQEYGLFGLYRQPWSDLGAFMTKKQTTALFDRVNPVEQRTIVDDKLAFHRHCLNAGLPVPLLHALICRNTGTSSEGFEVLRSFAELLQRYRHEADMRLILKPRRDALGTGVRLVHLRNGLPFDIRHQPIDPAAFECDLQNDMRRDDYLVQAFVTPHPTIAAWGSGKALGTLRIVTFMQAGRARMLYALTRIPTGNNVHDNFASGSSGNLIACIDVGAGTLQSAFGRRDTRFNRLLESFDTNPDTGQQLSGQVIPEWEEIGQVVLRAAETFAMLPLLGWDVALSDRGVVIIEANSNPDIVGSQVSCGRGARVSLRPLFN